MNEYIASDLHINYAINELDQLPLFIDFRPESKWKKLVNIDFENIAINNNNAYKVFFSESRNLTKKLLKDFAEKFQLIYLDPPYNTKRSRGARKSYSDNCDSSNWATDMSQIIANSHSLLKKTGFLALSINQMELFNLKSICDNVFGEDCFIGLFPVKIRHTERQLMINATYHDVYEYLLFYRKNKQTRFFTDF